MPNKHLILNSYLHAAGIEAGCIGVQQLGYTSVYSIKITPKTRISQIEKLTKELMLTLNALAPPEFHLNPYKGLLEIRVVDQLPTEQLLTTNDLLLKDLEMQIPINLGVSMTGNPIKLDLTQNPNLLLGGTTGSGKSNLLHLFINNILTNSNAEISILDTKGIEFEVYRKHFPNKVRIVNTYHDAIGMLKSLIVLMEQRYQMMRQTDELSQVITPYQILIIDEFADLSLQDRSKTLHNSLCRLAQKSRAAGIFSILATQRPSSDIITGIIKANFPARIACRTAGKTDSRIILDENGAESLMHKGNAIIKNYKYKFEKFQAFYSPVKTLPKLINSYA